MNEKIKVRSIMFTSEKMKNAVDPNLTYKIFFFFFSIKKLFDQLFEDYPHFFKRVE